MAFIGLALVWCMFAGYDAEVVQLTNITDWGGGRFEGDFNFPISDWMYGWEADVHFNEPITGMTLWTGDVIKKSDDNKEYLLVCRTNTAVLNAGDTLTITIQARYSGNSAPTGYASLINMSKDNQTVPPAPPVPGAKYNYAEVIEKSILFYEAQRSGKLPSTKRIVWRGDSALNDTGAKGEDLTGGWYDAGDNVKFGFPMSASVTLLAWGLLEYKDAYEAAGQLEYMYDSIRWPLEWFLKAHTAPEELYVQAGNGEADHSSWGRPEDMTMARPTYKVDASNPGSDVAGEYAAAMAASYLVFKDKDPTFADNLLKSARDIYAFALKYKGIYSDSVPDAASFYKSSGYKDELCWAGAWLYRATGEAEFLSDSESNYLAGPDWGQSWDDKMAGAQILLYKLTNKTMYATDIEGTFKGWLPGGNVSYSPKGLAFRSQWGSLRYASNMVFMALLASDAGLHTDDYRTWAKSQLHYSLGDTGRSFVVGFGVNPPSHPHHRGSSCPLIPAPCSWEANSQKGPNPHVLYGALVGGPDGNDNYVDSRNNYVDNEVACDYNAGFQSAAAGLLHLSLKGQLP